MSYSLPVMDKRNPITRPQPQALGAPKGMHSVRDRLLSFAKAGGPSTPTKLALATAILSCCFASSGCRRAAFTELYVENMAGEIRALEDRIYEYDEAYRALEQDVDDLRAANAELTSRYRSKSSKTGELQLGSEPVEVEPVPVKPSNKPKKNLLDLELDSSAPKLPSSPPPLKSEEKPQANTPAPIIPEANRSRGESSPRNDQTNPPSELLPRPALPSGEPGNPPANESLLPPPVDKLRSLLPGDDKKTQLKSKQGDLVQDVVMPPRLIRSAQQTSGSESVLQPSEPPSQLIDPPSLDPSKGSGLPLAPPPLPKIGSDKGATLQGRIQLPFDPQVKPASATAPATESESPTSSAPTDLRIVEISFHPTLCRGHNFDDKPGDDGLYLVVVPRNQRGQPINRVGKLTVVAEETVDGKAHRIAAWDISSKELSEYLEPIGASQGFHVSLPWKESSPTQSSLQVFIKYELEDGRSLVNRKDMNLRRPGSRQTTWTPR